MKEKDDKPILLIMPDIHGRTFWLTATRAYPGLPVIFLGDYLDPYTRYEGILPGDALDNFKAILDFKRANMDSVTLLLGNHDIHYFEKDINCSRKDKERYEEIHQLFSEALPLFRLAATASTAGRVFLFTHAGVDLGWLRNRMPEVDAADVAQLCSSLNSKLATDYSLCHFIFNGLMDVTPSRWGSARHPSPVWADVYDHQHAQESMTGVFQIFGHTMQKSSPVFTEQYACLDCRKPFLLTSKGKIVEA